MSLERHCNNTLLRNSVPPLNVDDHSARIRIQLNSSNEFARSDTTSSTLVLLACARPDLPRANLAYGDEVLIASALARGTLVKQRLPDHLVVSCPMDTQVVLQHLGLFMVYRTRPGWWLMSILSFVSVWLLDASLPLSTTRVSMRGRRSVTGIPAGLMIGRITGIVVSKRPSADQDTLYTAASSAPTFCHPGARSTQEHTMSSSFSTPVRLSTALLCSAFLVSACSDSNDAENTTVEDSVRVDFDIEVPAYVSDELQLRLVWGDKDIAAGWTGDEFWSASDEFPADTSNPLVVTFHDRNGNITLASFEENFRTGSEALQSFQITGDQFDTERWDSDNDGVSNINELINGTDPLLDETTQLSVRESYHDDTILEAVGALSYISSYYEEVLPRQRPYSEQSEVDQPFVRDPFTPGESSSVMIDIDEQGTGRYSDLFRSEDFDNVHVENRVATRTNTDKVITWTGRDEFSDSSAGLSTNTDFTTETQLLDTQERRQTGVIDRTRSGYGQDGTIRLSYSLTGSVIDSSSRCEPTAGTISYDRGIDSVGIATISKSLEDQFWTVSVEGNGTTPEQYLIQNPGTDFYCDFDELQ